jgi:hypothetical protein
MTSPLLLRVLSLSAVVGLCSTNASAESKGSAGVVEISNKGFPGYVVDDVVVPVPSEIFSVLDKLGEPNWRQELHDVKSPSTTDRTRLALLFGTTVAEGFVAVQAQDKKAVEDIGREVIDLSTTLGIKSAVLPHANAILDASKKNDWPTIRKEFDLTQKTVRDTMDKMKDRDLSQCVSIGGWLRGTAAVTSVISKNFSADRAELLGQPMLVNHFISQIGKMSSTIKSHATIKEINEGLGSIKGIMDKSTEGFSAASVESIGKTCHRLLGLIDGKTK